MAYKQYIIATGILLSSISALAYAAPSNAQLQKEIKALQNELKQNSQQKKTDHDAEKYAGIGTRGFLNDRLVFGGGVMTEASLSNYQNSGSYVDGKGRDLRLSTAYLNLHGIVSKTLSGFLMISTEPGQVNVSNTSGGVQFEEAYGNYFKRVGEQRYNIQVGRVYMPFGIYKIHPVVASLTQTLDETNRIAAVFGYATPPFFASLYTFGSADNTSIDKNNNTTADKLNYGGRIGAATIRPHFAYEVDADLISNMAQARDIAFLMRNTRRPLPNLALHGMLSFYNFDFGVNWSTPIGEFSYTDMRFDGKKASPSAFAVGISYHRLMMNKLAKFSISYEQSKQALALRLPQNRVAFSNAWELTPYMDVVFEVLRSEDYSKTTSYQIREVDSLSTLAYGTGRANISGVVQLALHF
jgi:hypothetical protein